MSLTAQNIKVESQRQTAAKRLPNDPRHFSSNNIRYCLDRARNRMRRSSPDSQVLGCEFRPVPERSNVKLITYDVPQPVRNSEDPKPIPKSPRTSLEQKAGNIMTLAELCKRVLPEARPLLREVNHLVKQGVLCV